jgi:predicted lipoprotein
MLLTLTRLQVIVNATNTCVDEMQCILGLHIVESLTSGRNHLCAAADPGRQHDAKQALHDTLRVWASEPISQTVPQQPA